MDAAVCVDMIRERVRTGVYENGTGWCIVAVEV